jgi:hypothetical protein
MLLALRQDITDGGNFTAVPPKFGFMLIGLRLRLPRIPEQLRKIG